MTWAKVKRFLTRNWLTLVLGFFVAGFLYLLFHFTRRAVMGMTQGTEEFKEGDSFWVMYGKLVGGVFQTLWNVVSYPFKK